ncbi:sulfate/molybdate ABC transporter ATP-binding protein [Pedococcus sp.]|uniref:sulfate/molybdate ABC transporter ATP-binding protein n=1 Tax=Pedococcus sp. TaxID=2860345 RepID=UPI002E0FF625|nr:ATP-binding cassette domain-containing protein [Pedococcus sp.]
MTLHAELRVASRSLDLRLDVPVGRTLAILGPNGAGKSTTLACLAGLLRPDSGQVALGDRMLYSDEGDAWVPPHQRSVGLLAQEPRLFPHLSVLENVAFGPRSSGMPRGQARAAALEWLGEVDLLDRANDKPGQLSGGQAQRVAIARALAAQPELVLLDEPLSSLDVQAKPDLRKLLRRVLAGRTTVLVTHDILDAILLADEVAIAEQGRIVEHGPTTQVLSRPTSAFAARSAGLNLIRGIAEGSAVRSPEGLRVEGLPEDSLRDGQAAVAVFSPNAVSVFREPPAGSPRNTFDAEVTELEPHGHQVRVHTAYVAADVTPAAVAELDLVPGTRVALSVKASEVAVYAG